MEGWIDVEWMLFSEEGVRMLKEFAERTGWREREWKKGRWKGEGERRYECRLMPKEVDKAGWLGEVGEERRRRELSLRRERKRRYRERRGRVWYEFRTLLHPLQVS